MSEKPLTDIAAEAADGPGIGKILIFFLIHSSTNILPGSEIAGVPASETREIILPSFIKETILLLIFLKQMFAKKIKFELSLKSKLKHQNKQIIEYDKHQLEILEVVEKQDRLIIEGRAKGKKDYIIICSAKDAVGKICPDTKNITRKQVAYMVEWSRFGSINKYKWDGSAWKRI